MKSMKRLLVVCVAVAVVASLAWAARIVQQTETVQMTAGSRHASGTVYLGQAVTVTGVAGEIVFNQSNYTSGGFGAVDTAVLVLYSTMGGVRYTLDSGLFTPLPGTLVVNNYTDSLFLGDVRLDWDWGDSALVPTGSTAVNTMSILLKMVP